MTDDPSARIVLAEYQGGHLFALTVERVTGGHDHYDFDWCRRDGTLYYHLSGFGAADKVIDLGDLVEQPDEPMLYYLAPGYRCKGGHWMTRITEPLDADPFAHASEGTVRCCEQCGDYLPQDRDVLCAHLEWCHDCADYTPRTGGACDCLALQLIELDQQLETTPPQEQAPLTTKIRELRARYEESERQRADDD